MILGIIGITIGLIAIGLFFWLKKDQDQTNDLVDSDYREAERAYNALMEDFTHYQVETDRKIAELEKLLEIKETSRNRQINKLIKELPLMIGNVIGHIEFAQPLDKK